MNKYLYERKTKNGIERKIFVTSTDLFLFLLNEGEKIFNNGFTSAEINLYRIEEQKKYEKIKNNSKGISFKKIFFEEI